MKENKWYVIAKEDRKKKFGFTQVTKKGEYYTKLKDANIDRIWLQSDFNEKLVVLRRTCRVVK